MAFDPYNVDAGLLNSLQEGSTIGSFNSEGTSYNTARSTFDWNDMIRSIGGVTTSIISASTGHSYQVGEGGYGGGGYGAPTSGRAPGGQGVYAGGSFLGASGFGQISGTTLLLIGLAAVFLLRGGRR